MAAAATTAVEVAAKSARTAGLPLGRKKIYLFVPLDLRAPSTPNFTLTLLRTPFLPPNYASFITPLNLNKFDIRDYLYHAYGIRVFSVRSFVQQQRVRQDKPNARNPAPRRWFRPRSIKKMTVQMEMPFVWPDEPQDLTAWDKEAFDATQKAQKQEQERMYPELEGKPSPERRSIAEQARELLQGRAPWTPTWEDVGEPEEVEKEVIIPQR
ncbi:MAG: hypothetical protein M1833_005646 [Piccolia ochrophora]|nr:MAG: hypothetical protein M1833_005646 [Piccolia ochrophora]